MKIVSIIVCIALFLFGMWIGTLKEPETKIVEITESVDYIDFTAPDLKHRLEVCANFLELTLREIDKRPSIDELHNQWLSGYKEGYRAAMTK